MVYDAFTLNTVSITFIVTKLQVVLYCVFILPFSAYCKYQARHFDCSIRLSVVVFVCVAGGKVTLSYHVGLDVRHAALQGFTSVYTSATVVSAPTCDGIS